MRTPLKASALAFAIAALTAGAAFAGGGCGGAVTAGSPQGREVAQIDQSSVPLPQTPRPEETAK